MQDPGILIPITLFVSLGLAAIIILRGPMGKAIADRIAGRTGPDARELEDLHAEVEELRHRLTDAEGRLDFAERLLSRQREAEKLPGTER